VPEQKQRKDSYGTTLGTTEAETKGGMSQYKVKKTSGYEQEQTADKTNRSPGRSPKHQSKTNCTAKQKLQ
jgi:hypothetical protein